MKLPGLSLLKDKWVWMGVLAGGAVYWFTSHHGYARGKTDYGPPGMNWNITSDTPIGGGGYSLSDRPGLYEVPNNGFENMRFSGQAELQRRLTIT